MEINYAFLCDHANVSDDGGKLNALGIGIDVFLAPNAPFVHPSFYLVVQLQTSPGELEGQAAEVVIWRGDRGNDEREVIKRAAIGSIAPPSEIEPSEKAIGRLVVGVRSTRFPDFGQYSISLLVGGKEALHLPIMAVQRRQPERGPEEGTASTDSTNSDATPPA